MKQALPPMFDFTEKCIVHRGRYAVQLEIPYMSSVTDNDTGRILQISSWKMDDMDRMADAYEGARGVKIGKDRRSYNKGIELDALYISGVGFRKLERIEGIREALTVGNKMHPPSVENFYEHVDMSDGIGSTANVRDGVLVMEREDYAPLGSYTEGRAREKIMKTIEAGNLPLTRFAVPKLEAYGRYIDLQKGDEHLSFIVFSVPTLDLRLGSYILRNFNDTFGNFCSYMSRVASVVGEGARELHEAGKCHRQLHFDNIYYNPGSSGKCRAYVMDWGTSQNLDGIDHVRRAIDIRRPWQTLETLQRSLFGNVENEGFRGMMTVKKKSIEFVQQMLSSYFKRNVDLESIYLELISQGIKDDNLILIETMKKLLYQT